MRFADLFSAFRRVDRLLNLDDVQRAALKELAAEIADIKTRVIRLENPEDTVVVEARSAASAAASQALNTNLTDIAHRLGRLEERSLPRRLEQEPP